MILNKTQKQELLTKHAKFFAADKKAVNPVFQGVHYPLDGSACVTDTHALLRIKDVSSAVVERTVHAITGAELYGVFPSTDAINNLLYWNQENQITLDSAQIEACAKYAKIAQMTIKELRAYDKIVKLVLTGENCFLQVSYKELNFDSNAYLGELASAQNETWNLNPDYLHNAFNLFKSAKSDSIVIKFRHEYDSIFLRDEENGIEVLIMPIRTNAEVRDS